MGWSHDRKEQLNSLAARHLASVGGAAANLAALPIVVLSLVSASWLAVAPAGQDCFEVLNGMVSSGPGLAICVVGSVSTSGVTNFLVSPTWVSWASCVAVLVLLVVYWSRSRGGRRSRFGNGLVLALSLAFALSPILSWVASGIGCGSVAVEHGSDTLHDKTVGLPAGLNSWQGSCGSPSDIPDAAIVVWFLIAGCLMGGSLLWVGRRQAAKPSRNISGRIAVIFSASV